MVTCIQVESEFHNMLYGFVVVAIITWSFSAILSVLSTVQVPITSPVYKILKNK